VTVEELYKMCLKIIGASSDTPSLDAHILVQDTLGLDSNAFILKSSMVVSNVQAQKILEFARERAKGIPIAYLVGHKGFFEDDFFVDKGTLIPRPDTETLVEMAIEKACDMVRAFFANKTPAYKFNILDLCCGTGCVGISITKALARQFPNVKFKLDMVDISPEAISIAKQNISLLDGIKNVLCSVKLGNLFEPVKGETYHLIVSNPPYIKGSVVPTLDIPVQFEPVLALDGGHDGLDIIRRIIDNATQYMENQGWLLLEIGFDQGKIVKELFEKAGFTNVEIKKDLGSRDRVVMGQVL